MLTRLRCTAPRLFRSTWHRWSSRDADAVKYDLCIVGGGPAGLAAAIRTKQVTSHSIPLTLMLHQLAIEKEKEINVCVLEKGSAIGAHILSGCVLDPRSLEELLPNWTTSDQLPSLMTPAKYDRMYFLTETRSIRLPVVPQLRNKGCYIVSLSALTRWLGQKAEEMGVDIYPGFAASDMIFLEDGSIGGVMTKARGLDKNGKPKRNYEPGIRVESKATLLAEGCRGSLSQVVTNHFDLREDVEQQTYGLGIKEVWEIPEEKHREGTVMHSVGYPLPSSVYGGGFLYHMAERKVAVGIVVGLDYKNPYISIFQEFQKFKRHPLIRATLEKGSCLQYGARSLNEGGIQCIPKLNFPGGALIGCGAGFMNAFRLKGTHGAIKSGTMAAEAFVQEWESNKMTTLSQGVMTMDAYPKMFESSWLHDELHSVRNVRPMFRHGLYLGIISAVLHGTLLGGKEPYTFKLREDDRTLLKPAAQFTRLKYPKPDKRLSFDIPASLFLSGTDHDHDQQSHLRIRYPHAIERVNVGVYDKPETRYCPAGVYEYGEDAQGRQELRINAQNCLHCKACDIKDPNESIRWTVPEGGGGPNYTLM